jgi:hypothetical protein
VPALLNIEQQVSAARNYGFGLICDAQRIERFLDGACCDIFIDHFGQPLLNQNKPLSK